MRRTEAAVLMLIALAAIAGGVTWQFGALGLFAFGGLLAIATLFANRKEE